MNPVVRLWRTPELRKGLLFMLLCVTVFRIAAHIPVPGIDASGLQGLLASNQFLGLLNVFAGGTLESFSIVALGVAPYITASIIFQLLGMIFPTVEEMQKEEQGRQRINQWTRMATVPLALFQGYSLVMLLTSQGGLSSVPTLTTDPLGFLSILISMAAGTVFLMWLGELITEKKMGNGLSIMIFAGIIASLPGFIGQAVATYTPADLVDIILFAFLTLVTIVSVVVVTEAQRNIPVQYARAKEGGGRVSSSLPLRINMGGMIPIIFALSVIVLPPLVAQFFIDARSEWVRNTATWTIVTLGNNWVYGILYFVLVVAFTFFYTSVIFRPERIAENLQKQGGFILGVRPGAHTTAYLSFVMYRILLLGAVFLGLIAVLPVIVQGLTGNQNLVVGGSSVIIVVSVVIDILRQIDAQLSMRAYDHDFS